MTEPPKKSAPASWFLRPEGMIAGGATVGIALHLILRFAVPPLSVWGRPASDLPLLAVLALGGVPLVLELLLKVVKGEFSSDLLAGISIVTSVVLGELLPGALVVLMLSGGQALEAYALRSASSVLEALARRMPSVAHRQTNGSLVDVALDTVAIGDTLVVFPHEICPVDGTVTEGRGVMDESFLTGEPYKMSKAPGSAVLSGSINGDAALTILAGQRACDSRYATIMQVMRASEQHRPQLRRLGDQLGAYYTPLALVLAVAAWAASGDATRFLGVLVVATPCPLIIAIPVAIIGSISLAARRGIIIKDPAVLERIDTCRTAIFDKTGTLTYGQPWLTELSVAAGFSEPEILRLVGSLERYSKHPLAAAILLAARERHLDFADASEISEPPGEGMRGTIDGRQVQISGRRQVLARQPDLSAAMAPAKSGMECVVLIDRRYAAILHFRDKPRADGAAFIRHLRPRHGINRIMLVSGDQAAEVQHLAELVGIHEVFAGQSPEQKLEIVRRETSHAATLYLGDGINDAPALSVATVGVAFGQGSDITAEAAGAVILDSSLQRVDELLHIGRRLRAIALQSAAGGMVLSVAGMCFAAAGFLPPVAGALLQEAIDVLAVLNALRVAIPPRSLSDCADPE